MPIGGLQPLDTASDGDISFYLDPRYKESLDKTSASALIVGSRVESYQGPQVIVTNPGLASAKVAGLFQSATPAFEGISRQAVIDKSAEIGENCAIYPLAFVGRDVKIGNDCTLFPGVFVGDRVKIGDGALISPNVTIMHDCIIGNDVIIHGGTVIGSDGFGYIRDGEKNIKIPQTGIVQIDDHVEIGASNTIDRATFGRTWIQARVKTDDQVHIAHNVVVEADTIIVAQAAIGGSAHVGKGVVIGGQVAVADHAHIGDRAMIGSQSGVPKSVEPGDVVSGTPTMPHRLWLKTSSLIPRLPQFKDRLRKLEKRLEALEKNYK
jgi:UDP-3-O-[3-hydroxymyristoyl] glucosamine N-acyltransferase